MVPACVVARPHPLVVADQHVEKCCRLRTVLAAEVLGRSQQSDRESGAAELEDRLAIRCRQRLLERFGQGGRAVPVVVRA